MATFTIKEGDTSPAIEYVLSPATIVLTGATVVFIMADIYGNLKVNRAVATITDEGDGTATGTPTVQYDWDSADTNTAGMYRAEFEITYADLAVETFPNNEYIVINIMPDQG